MKREIKELFEKDYDSLENKNSGKQGNYQILNTVDKIVKIEYTNYRGDQMINLLNGDCLEVMKTLPDNSVDAIVTDPPYGLEFMGKHWDKGVPGVEFWIEMLRILKPGGHMLSFSGTRTYHRMATAIDDAGFEVRDMIEWVYSTGFPKSLNIGKKIDQLQGNEREELGRVKRAGKESGTYGQFEGNNMETKGTSEWEGWGTALKPAHEPICMARKPLSEKTVAENVLRWGTGGINIDESRVEAHDGNTTARKRAEVKDTSTPFGKGYEMGGNGSELGRFPANLIHDNSEEVRACFPETKGGAKKANQENYNHEGKEFVATLKASVNEYQASSGNASRFLKSIIYQAKASKSERNKGCEGLQNKKFVAGNYSQSPVCETCNKTLNGTNNHSACSGKVYYREMKNTITQNNHPTVKPIALMEYLIKMVTPKGGTVLDPFMGSGSTGVACKNLNRNFIGIEKEPEYFEIAKARIKGDKRVSGKVVKKKVVKKKVVKKKGG